MAQAAGNLRAKGGETPQGVRKNEWIRLNVLEVLPTSKCRPSSIFTPYKVRGHTLCIPCSNTLLYRSRFILTFHKQLLSSDDPRQCCNRSSSEIEHISGANTPPSEPQTDTSIKPLFKHPSNRRPLCGRDLKERID